METRSRHTLWQWLVALTLATALGLLVGQLSGLRAAGTIHYVAPDGVDSAACTVKQPCLTIQRAITNAANGDEIRVAAGTYTSLNALGGSQQVVYLNKNVTLIGGFSPTNWVTPDPEANPTILDAGNNGRVLRVPAGVNATVRGFTLRNGATNEDGAGVRNDGTLILEQVVIHNNRLTAENKSGAGIYSNGALVLKNSRLYANTVLTSGSGAAVHIVDGSFEIIGNEIYQHVGQGSLANSTIHVKNGTGTIARNRIYSNTLEVGAGVLIFNGTVVLENNLIYDNTANAPNTNQDNGGGVYVYGATVILRHNTLANNVAGENGGGLYVASGGQVTVTNSLFVNNTAGTGVGANVYAPADRLSMSYTDLWPAASFGGGMSDPVPGDNNRYSNPALDSNYRLTAASPARDSGNSPLTVDFEGKGRPFGSAVDRGADEYTEPSSCYARIGDGRVFTSIQAAVDAAQAGDLIKVAGTCSGVQTRNGSTQVVYIDKSITLQGGYKKTDWEQVRTQPTLINANGLGYGIYAAAGNVRIENLIVTNGVGQNGAGLFATSNVYLTVRNSIFTNNNATLNGGGIYASGSGSIEHSVFHANQAGQRGGGVYLNNLQPFSLRNNTFSNNTAGIRGGGVDYGGAGPVTLAYNNFHANLPDAHGAIPPSATTLSYAPAFVNPTGYDFHLQPTSALVNRADPAPTSVYPDFEGDPRPQGARADIGADERTTYAQLVLTPLSQARVFTDVNAVRGTTIIFNHTLKNEGNTPTLSDTFVITASNADGWPVTIVGVSSPVQLYKGESVAFQVRVQVPTTLAEGFDNQTRVRVTSQWGGTYEEAVDTIANSAFTLTPSYSENADPGEVLTYTHVLRNLGATDVFSINVTSNLLQPWGRLVAPLEPITVTHGQTATVIVQVNVPGKAAANLQEILLVRARSLAYGTSAVVTDTTTANPRVGDRYVAPNGDDRENNCTQSASPCKTISHAVGQAAGVDKILVAQGLYRENDTIRISQYNKLLGGYVQNPQTKAFELPNDTHDPATTIIDLQSRARALLIQSPGTDDASLRVEVKGFTLRNGATGAVGGAIYVAGNANPLLQHLIIENCSGTAGGALYIEAGAPTVRQVTIRGTQAERGGAVYVESGAPSFARVIISGTTATLGGALYNASGAPRLENTMVYSASATQHGGAFYNAGYLSAVNVTLYGNSAGGYGGAVYDLLSTGLQISNTLIISNVAGVAGGGLYREGNSALSVDYNNVWGNSAPAIPESNIPLGAHSFSADPHFVDAARGDLHLRFDSPALDSGDPNTALTEDFEGDPRPANQGFDIGADEITGCVARIINPATQLPTGRLYYVLQEAIDAAPGGAIIQISGRCLGAQPRQLGSQVVTQTAFIAKSLTLVGGYNATFSNDPAVDYVPTYFDAQGLGRTLLITNTGLAATVVISDITFVNGNGLRGDSAGTGGGIAVYNQTALIAHSVISNATALRGAGLYVEGGQVTFGEEGGRASQLIANQAQQEGGAAYVNGGALTLRGVWVRDNQATHGAGLYVAAGTLDAQRVRLLHNLASGKGGGAYAAAGSTFKLWNAIVALNEAFSGGGLYTLNDALELRHLTVYGNSATTQGGGLYHKAFSTTPLINSNIFAANNAASGSGIYNDGLKPHFDYNNVHANDMVNLTLSDGTGNLALDPLLRTALAPTDPAYLHLLPGSPMEDRADPTSPALEDIDGTPRPSNQGFDIGADELGDCYVRINGNPPTYGSIQRAANQAAAGDTLHVAGTCTGVNSAQDGGQTVTQALFINKTLQVQGGYTYTNWTLPPNPLVNITTIDALGQGRVVYLTGNSVVSMTGLHLVNGQGVNGAGIYVANGVFTLTQSTLAGNVATNNGGALYVAGGTVTLAGQTVITANQALRGGAIFNQDGQLLLDALVIANNTAMQQGGAYYHQGGNTRLRNSFIYGNQAQNGGAIYNNTTAPLEILNNTLYANQATERGGGMYTLNSLPVLKNTIFATNTAGLSGQALYSAMAYQPDYNVFYPQAAAVNPEVVPGPHTLYVDPRFVAPAQGDLHLASDSPLFDRGDPQTALAHDFDGDLRPADQGYDIGADERQGCWAKNMRTGTIYANPQLAVYASQNGDEIRITVGECRGVHPVTLGGQVMSQTLHVTRSLTLSGGWTRDFTQQYLGPYGYPDPTERSTTLLPQGLGRALLITATSMITIERVQMVGGTPAGSGGATLPDAGGNLLYAAGDGIFIHVDFYEGTATYGGALYKHSGKLTLADSWNANNTATVYGGALFNASGPLTVTVLGSGNTAIGGSWYRNNIAGQRGGALYVAGGAVKLEDGSAEYFHNTAQQGGVVYVAPGGTLTVTAGVMYTNTAAQSGGALYNAGTLFLYGGALRENRSEQDGGALYNTGTAYVDLGPRLYWNSAARNGGAIYAGGIFNALRNSVMYLNTAQRGAALYVAAGAPNIWHNTFHANRASVEGGAIYVASSAGSALQIKNNIFSDNEAPQGQAIYSNQGQVDYNNYWPTDASNQVSGGVGAGTNNFNANPMYVKPQVTQQFPGDFHLQDKSPLIDVGIELGVTRDMDGEPRPSNARPDLGADEVMNCLVKNPRLNKTYGRITPAINEAEDNDVLYLAEGVCYENVVLNKALTLDGSWDKGFNSKLEEIKTTIDGQEQGRTLRVNGVSAIVRDVILRKGSIQGNGGGVLVESGSTLNLSNAQVNASQASLNGGGMYVSSGATLNLIDVGFYDNTATGDGGALYLADGSTASLTYLTAYRNTATRGGGVYIAPNAQVQTFENTTLGQNTASTQGGGLYNALAGLKLVNTRFYQNSAQDGAGIYNSAAQMRVLHGTLHQNSATNQGGALYNLGAGTVVSASIVASNTAASGAGIYGATAVAVDYVVRFANDFHQANGPHIKDADPRFYGTSDHLRYTSPAIDYVPSPASEVNYDYQGLGRPQICAHDAGYREYYVAKRLLTWVDTPNPPLNLTDAEMPITTTFSLRNDSEYWLNPYDYRTSLGPGTGYTETIQISLTTLRLGWSRIVRVDNAANVTIAANGRSAGFSLGPGATAVIHVVTTPPPGTFAYEKDTIAISVNATLCDRDPLQISSAQATVQVRANDSFEIGPDNVGAALPGQTITYTHRITNTGNFTQELRLFPKAGFYGSGQIISPTAELLPLRLGPGESYPITFTVTINREAAGGLVDVTSVVGLNQNNAQRAAANNTTISYTTGVRYVSPLGTDSLVNETIGNQDPNAVDLPDNNCTQPQIAPCYSLAHALQQAAVGDEIHLATGVYTQVMSTTYQSQVITQTLFVNKSVTLRGGYDAANWQSTELITPTTLLNPQGQGRALVIPEGVTVHVDRIAFTGGQATEGGALFNAGTLKLTNSLFYGNSGTTGGALYTRGTLTAWNNTFYNNSAGTGSGGALYMAGGTASVRNTIFANNTAATGSALHRASGTLTLDYNLYWQNTVSGTSTGANDKVGLDPQFVNATAAPPNLRLRSTSPARDAADPATDYTTFPRDLGNASRRMGPRIDIGAYEYVINIGARLTPDYTRVLPKGTVITYTHTLTNTGEMTDTFTLNFSSSQGWGELLTPGPFTLPAGATAQVQVRVSVPTGNVGGLQDTSIVTATSEADPTKTARAVDKTMAEFIPGVTLTPNHETPDAAPGSVIVYEHLLTNTGDGQDTFTLSYDSTQGWASAPTPASVTLGAGMTTTVRITVTMPAGALQGIQDTTRVTATSTFSPAVKAGVVNVTIVGGAAGLQLTPATQQAAVDAGAPFTYTFTVTNTGNAPATITFAAQSSLGWSYTILPPSLSLNAGAAAQVRLVLQVPPNSGNQTDVTAFTATSSAGPTRSATVTSIVRAVAGVSLTPSSQTKTTPPGTTVVYTYTVTNQSNATAAITLDKDNTAGWATTLTPSVISSLAPGASAQVLLTVTVPPSAEQGATTHITATASVPNAAPARAYASAITHIPMAGGPLLEPDRAGVAAPGGSATYEHTLTNTGNVTDTYTLSYHSSQGWTVSFNPSGPITLGPGASHTIIATVNVPASATPGSVDTTVITATAQSDAGRFDTATDVTTIIANVTPTLTPDYARSLKRGESTVYTHTLTNPGSASETYVLSASSTRGWATLLTPSPVTVPAGGSTSVAVRVTVPTSGVTPGMQDVTTVKAAVQSAPTLFAQAVNTTTVAPTAGVQFTPNRSASADPGTVVTYTHTITNTGDASDTFTFSYSNSAACAAWTVTLPTPVTLAPNAAANVQVRVHIPVGATANLTCVTTVRATSQLDAAVSASVNDATTVNTYRAFALTPRERTRSARPGHTMTQTLVLTNTGNVPDTYTYSLVDTPSGWATLTPAGPIALQPGQVATLTLTVQVPTDAENGSQHFSSIMVTSQSDLNLSQTASITTLVVQTPGVALWPDRTGTRAAGLTISYLHYLRNTGSARDVFNISAVSAHGWPVKAPPFVIVNAGVTQTLIITLTVPSDVISGTVDVLTLTASSDADASVWAAVTDTTTVTQRIGMAFTPTEQRGSTWPNQPIVYTHVLTNTGNYTDTFDITYTSTHPEWVTVTPSVATLGINQSVEVRVTVTPAPNMGGIVEETVVTARSRSNPNANPASVRDFTTVLFTAGVALSPGYQQIAAPGGLVTYTHTITNTGTGQDTYALSITSSHNWPIVSRPPAQLTLAAGEAATFSVVLQVPRTTYSGTLDILTVEARSTTFTNTVATAQDRTLVQGTPSFKLYLPLVLNGYPPHGVNLRVVDIQVGPLDAQNRAVITVTTMNIGDQPVAYGNNFYVDLYIFFEDPYRPPPLTAGNGGVWGVQGHWYEPWKPVILTTTYTFPVGANWTFYAQIDTDKHVVEWDEDDNVFGPLVLHIAPGGRTLLGLSPELPRPVPLSQPRPVPPLQP